MSLCNDIAESDVLKVVFTGDSKRKEDFFKYAYPSSTASEPSRSTLGVVFRSVDVTDTGGQKIARLLVWDVACSADNPRSNLTRVYSEGANAIVYFDSGNEKDNSLFDSLYPHLSDGAALIRVGQPMNGTVAISLYRHGAGSRCNWD